MGWYFLCVAGVFEVVWAIEMKYTDGFSRLWPSVGTVFAMSVSFYFLALSLKSIPVGTAYAVWAGIGAAGTAVLGIVLFAESAALTRLISFLLIVAGIVGLKITS